MGKSTHISSMYLRTGEPTGNKGNVSHICIYSIHLRTEGPKVDKRCHTYSIHLCTVGPTVDQRKVTRIFDSSPHRRTICGQKGKSHILCSMHLRTGGSNVDKDKATHIYIQLFPHQLITAQHDIHKYITMYIRLLHIQLWWLISHCNQIQAVKHTSLTYSVLGK